MLQQHARQLVDIAHMRAAFLVAEFHDMAENINHNMTGLLFFFVLLLQKRHQRLLLGVKQHGIQHAALHNARIKRTVDIICRTHLVSLTDGADAFITGDNNNRHLINQMRVIHLLQHLEAVHHRHHDIEQHERDIFFLLAHDVHSFQTVFCFDNIIFILQNFLQQEAVHLRIINNQHVFLLLVIQNAAFVRCGLCNNDIFAQLRMIHKLVCTLQRFSNCLILQQHATDADGQG